MLNEYPGIQELLERSSNRTPSASSTSHVRAASLAWKTPLRPTKPAARGSAMSSAPKPLGEKITGIRKRWARAVRSSPASESVTPCPT